MTKYTPGPWQAEHDERPGMKWNIHIVQAETPNNRICFMTSDGPVEANARLIAAAPDLLEALHAIVKIIEELNVSRHYPSIENVRAVRAAIAKAEGRSS